jgi:hypothetical protein
MAFVAVLAVAEVKANAVFPILCDVKVFVVNANRAARVAEGLVDVKTERDNRDKIEVPPTTMP